MKAGADLRTMTPLPRRGTGGRGAFTLLELLVVIALGLLAALWLPALGKAKTTALAANCRNNLQQLQLCRQMYAGDNRDRVPPNRSVALYHCPADQSRVLNLQTGQQLPRLRTRSYSMSGCLGGWTNEVQSTVAFASQIPGPVELFVFIDEDQDSIDDANFLTWPAPDDRGVNLPEDRHNQSGVLSFADGHFEGWKWKWPKQFKVKQSYWKRAEKAADLADSRRLQGTILRVPDFRPQP